MAAAWLLIVPAVVLMLLALPEMALAVPPIVLAVPLIFTALPLIAEAVPLIVPPVLLIVPAEPLMDLASPSTDWASVMTWANFTSSGLALFRMELAVSLVRLSWMTESVAVLMPCPVLAMFSALWLIRFAALAVRANKDTLTSPATITTATTTPFVSATAPRSLRHRARFGLKFRLANFPPPCRTPMVPQGGGRRFPQGVDTEGDAVARYVSGAATAIAPLRRWRCAPAHRPGDRPQTALPGRLRGSDPVSLGENSLRVGALVHGQARGPEVARRAVLRCGGGVERQRRIEHLEGLDGDTAAEIVEGRPGAGDARAPEHLPTLFDHDVGRDVLGLRIHATVLRPGPGEGVGRPGPAHRLGRIGRLTPDAQLVVDRAGEPHPEVEVLPGPAGGHELVVEDQQVGLGEILDEAVAHHPVG